MPTQVTVLLRQYREGDDTALDQLARLVYPELKAMARRRAGASGMGATTLVNGTFLKLLSGGAVVPEDRAQFFALMATIMRRLIVDEVRHVSASKRSMPHVTYTEGLAGGGADDAEFLILVDRVLGDLEREDPRLVRVFEARYFAGLTVDETSEALGISGRSVERLWAAARERIADLVRNNMA